MQKKHRAGGWRIGLAALAWLAASSAGCSSSAKMAATGAAPPGAARSEGTSRDAKPATDAEGGAVVSHVVNDVPSDATVKPTSTTGEGSLAADDPHAVDAHTTRDPKRVAGGKPSGQKPVGASSPVTPAPLAPPPPPPPPPPEKAAPRSATTTSLGAELTSADVDAALAPKLRQLRSCATSDSSVSVHIAVAPGGRVSEASVTRSTPDDGALRDCVVLVLRMLSFRVANDDRGSALSFDLALRPLDAR